MSYRTATEVQQEFRRTFPDATDTDAAELFLDALRQLSNTFPFYTQDVSLALTSGSALYGVTTSASSPWYVLGTSTEAATESIVAITEAFYAASATDIRPLQQVLISDLDMINPRWRYDDAGTPQYIYVKASTAGNLQVGLHPKPDTSSSPANGSGYPRVDLYCKQAPLSAPSELPVVMYTDQAVLYYMCLRYAVRVGDNRIDMFQQLSSMYQGKVRMQMASRLRRARPGWVTGKRWVRV